MGNWSIDLYDFGDVVYYDDKAETEKVFREVTNGLIRMDMSLLFWVEIQV